MTDELNRTGSDDWIRFWDRKTSNMVRIAWAPDRNCLVVEVFAGGIPVERYVTKPVLIELLDNIDAVVRRPWDYGFEPDESADSY